MKLERVLPLAACLLAFGLAPAFAATQMPREAASTAYTSALNAFMANGWHAASDMHIVAGNVVASAVNSHGQMHQVIYHPGSRSVTVKQG